MSGIRVTRLAGFGRKGAEDFSKAVVTLGTGVGSDVRFDPSWDRGVAGEHCRIEMREGQCVVVDAGSAAGTFVGGRRVSGAVTIPTGAEIELGQGGPRVRVEFSVEGAAAAVAPPAVVPLRESAVGVAMAAPAARAGVFGPHGWGRAAIVSAAIGLSSLIGIWVVLRVREARHGGAATALAECMVDAGMAQPSRETVVVGDGDRRAEPVPEEAAVPPDADLLPWDGAGSFSEGLALVSKGELWGFVDKSGGVVILLRWAAAGPFREGLAPVSEAGGWGLIDKQGRVVVRPELEAVGSCSEGRVRFKRKNAEKWGFMDRNGEEVIKAALDAASDFSDGLAVVRLGEEDCIIDASGSIRCRIAERVSFDSTNGGEIWGISFPDGPIPVEQCLDKPPPWWVAAPDRAEEERKRAEEKEKDKDNPYANVFGSTTTYEVYGFADKTGRLAIDFRWDFAGKFHEGRAAVGLIRNGVLEFGFIDRTGTYISEPQWLKACDFSEGLAAVMSAEGWGFIDLDGRVAISPRWKSVEACAISKRGFREGLAAVRAGDHWGYTDREGRMVVPAHWKIALDFHEGLAAVMGEGDKWGFIDRDGRVVVRPQWDNVRDFSEGCAVVTKGDKAGFIDRSGVLMRGPAGAAAGEAGPPPPRVEADGGTGGTQRKGEP